MSTTTLSLVNATTRPSVIVPSSRFLKVSSYRAANASRSNCGSFDFETILMGTVLLFRRPSGADDQCYRCSLSVANTGTCVMVLRWSNPTQSGDPLHHDSTHLMVKLLRLRISIPGKRQRRAKRHGHGMKPRPFGTRRQDITRAFEICRHDWATRLRDDHTQASLGMPQSTIKAPASLRKNHHDLPGLDQGDRPIEGLTIQPAQLERDPPKPLQGPFHAGHEQITAAQI